MGGRGEEATLVPALDERGELVRDARGDRRGRGGSGAGGGVWVRRGTAPGHVSAEATRGAAGSPAQIRSPAELLLRAPRLSSAADAALGAVPRPARVPWGGRRFWVGGDAPADAPAGARRL